MSAVLKPRQNQRQAQAAPFTIADAVAEYEGGQDVRRMEVMRRYAQSWWLSNDPTVIAYWQLRQPVLLVPFERLLESVELCLGGPVDVARLLDPQQLFNEIFNPYRSAH